MGILLCEQHFQEVWRRNENVRAEIGQIVHTHTHAAQLVVRIITSKELKSQWGMSTKVLQIKVEPLRI